jgi:hypothetical protein
MWQLRSRLLTWSIYWFRWTLSLVAAVLSEYLPSKLFWALLFNMAPISTVLPLLLALPYASAWGSLGHTTVGYIAQNFVSGKTIKFAQRLLNDTSDNYLASVATWADSYRNEKGGAYSAPYHFIVHDPMPSGILHKN